MKFFVVFGLEIYHFNRKILIKQHQSMNITFDAQEKNVQLLTAGSQQKRTHPDKLKCEHIYIHTQPNGNKDFSNLASKGVTNCGIWC